MNVVSFDTSVCGSYLRESTPLRSPRQHSYFKLLPPYIRFPLNKNPPKRTHTKSGVYLAYDCDLERLLITGISQYMHGESTVKHIAFWGIGVDNTRPKITSIYLTILS